MTMATASLSYKVCEKAVKSALQKVNIGNISSFTQPQTRSLFTFLCGNGTFVPLPTGHGKSFTDEAYAAYKTNRVFRCCPGPWWRLFNWSFWRASNTGQILDWICRNRLRIFTLLASPHSMAVLSVRTFQWLTYFDNEVDWGSVSFPLEHDQ